MIYLIVRRILGVMPVLVGTSVLVFGMIHLVPGDPAEVILFGASPTPEQIEALREELGLNEPLVVQYLTYAGNLLEGDLGYSYIRDQSIARELAVRAPNTLILTAAASGVALLLGVPIGFVSGVRAGTWIDRVLTTSGVLLVAVPFFWLALVLILVFSVKLGLLPSLGAGSPEALVLPAVSLGAGYAAVIARLLRSSVIEVYREDYIRAARAKGLLERQILLRHAMRNAAMPAITMFGLLVGNMITTAAIIEVVFGRRGVGSYLVDAIVSRDIPAVQGTVLFIAVTYVLLNLFVDIIHGVLDPRVREQEATRV